MRLRRHGEPRPLQEGGADPELLAAARPAFPAAFAATPFAVAFAAPRLARLDGDLLAGFLIDGAHRQLDLAAVVEADDLDLHLVAQLEIGISSFRERVCQYV